MTQPDTPAFYRGIVLLSTLVFATVMAAVVAGALRVATLEVRMAENTTIRLLASELADSIISRVILEPTAFPLDLPPGPLPCPEDVLETVCDVETADSDWTARYSVSRLAPAVRGNFPLREPEAVATGTGHFGTAMFELSARVDSSILRGSAFHAVQGVALRVPAVDE